MKLKKNTLTAAIIIIGNEILSGRTKDQNLNVISLFLEERGIRVVEARVIPDTHDFISQTVKEMSDKYTYVFTTGGIGPTHDDITPESVSMAFNQKHIIHPEARADMAKHYGDENLNEARLRMATMPEDAELIYNKISFAPGFKIKNVFVMAGIPHIMKAMLESVADYLDNGDKIHSYTIKCHCKESDIAKMLADLQHKYDDHIEIGSYPFKEEEIYGTNLVLRSTNQDELSSAGNDLMTLLKNEHYDPILTS